MQITAFGASDVPDVKMSAHSVSGIGLEARVVVADRGQRGRRGRRRTAGRVARVGEAVRHERRERAAEIDPEQAGDACRGSVTSEADVGVLDVAQQVLAPPGVVQADDGRAGEAPRRRTRRGSRACCRAARRRAAVARRRRAGGARRKRFAQRHASAASSAWVHSCRRSGSAGRSAVSPIGRCGAAARPRPAPASALDRVRGAAWTTAARLLTPCQVRPAARYVAGWRRRWPELETSTAGRTGGSCGPRGQRTRPPARRRHRGVRERRATTPPGSTTSSRRPSLPRHLLPLLRQQGGPLPSARADVAEEMRDLGPSSRRIRPRRRAGPRCGRGSHASPTSTGATAR